MAVDTAMITPAQTDETPQRCTVCGSHRPLRRVESERWGDYWKCWSCGFEFRSMPREEFATAGGPDTDPGAIVEPPGLHKRKPHHGRSAIRVPTGEGASAAVEHPPEFRDAQRSPLRPGPPASRPAEPLEPALPELSGQDRCPCGCGRRLPEPVRAPDGGQDVHLEAALTTWLAGQGYALSDLRWSRTAELIEARRRAAGFLRDHDWSLADIGRFLCTSTTTVSALLRHGQGVEPDA